MKNIIAITLFVAGIFVIVSCSNKSTAPGKKEELKQPTIGDDIPSEVATSIFDKAPITKDGEPSLDNGKKDCHGERLVTQNLEEVDGSIIEVAGRFVIGTNNGTDRYNPCELPGKFKQNGLSVRFSGEVLEIRPGERLIATPFRLRNIVERDN